MEQEKKEPVNETPKEAAPSDAAVKDAPPKDDPSKEVKNDKDTKEVQELKEQKPKSAKLVDKLFVRVCKKLKTYDKELNDKFIRLTTNFDRFKFIWSIGFIHAEIDAVLENPEFDGKNQEKAADYRKKGNEFFKDVQFLAALSSYNQCLKYAINFKHLKAEGNEVNFTEDENHLAFAFANRAAVYFHIGQYQQCINDIQRAVNYGYPARLKHKLVERRVNSLFRLECYDEVLDVLKAESSSVDSDFIKNIEKKIEELKFRDDYPGQKVSNILRETNPTDLKNYGNISFEIDEKKKNSRIVNATSSLTIDYSFEKGFYLKATKDIEPGELLVNEPPYASVLLGDYIETHCYECMLKLHLLNMNVTYCRQCTLVTYCSSHCEKLSWKSHKYECKYTRFLAYKSGITHMEWLALRIVLRAGHDSLLKMKPELIAYENKHENYKRDESAFENLDIDHIYRSDSYITIFNLLTNSGVRKLNDLFRRAFLALLLVKLIIKTGFFEDDGDTNSNKFKDSVCYIGGLILRHSQSISCNAHEVGQLRIAEGKQALAKSSADGVGAGIYSILSLFNHSCDPHVTRNFRGNQSQVRSIRGIKKDEEITDSYGVLYAVSDIEERQIKLLDQYFFQCCCVACEKDWPLYDKIPADLDKIGFKCDNCKKVKKTGYCNRCEIELDELKLYQLKANQSLRMLLSVKPTIDLSNEGIIKSLEDIFESLCRYLQVLEEHRIKRPFQDYNNYQEALKQCLNLINIK